MSEKKGSTDAFLDRLADIRPLFFQKKKQAIELAEQLISRRDLGYIPEIISCFPVEGYQLSQLDADMRRLRIICEILLAEDQFSGKGRGFLDNVDSFESLIQKYVSITFWLRRLEFQFPENVRQNTAEMFAAGGVSVYAVRKITSCEIFADSEYVYRQALGMMGDFEIE